MERWIADASGWQEHQMQVLALHGADDPFVRQKTWRIREEMREAKVIGSS